MDTTRLEVLLHATRSLEEQQFMPSEPVSDDEYEEEDEDDE